MKQRSLDTRFRYIDLKVAGFVLIPVAIILLAVYLIGKENDLFRPTYRLLFTVAKGTGFSRGMPVKLSGFRVGRLADMRLNDQARVDIMIDIDRSCSRWIREDSTVSLVKEGIVGESVLELSVGSQRHPPLPDGGRIRYEETKSLEELATEVTEKVTPVLLEIREIISYINDPKGDVKQLVKNLNSLSGRLDQTLDSVDHLVAQTSQQSAPLMVTARETIVHADRVLTGVETALLTLNRFLPPILESSERTISTTARITSDIEQSSSNILPRIPRLLDRTESTLETSEELMDGAKRIWPLKRVIPSPPPPFLPVTGDE
ncbi:MAG: MlaD family protein [Desulfuromonadia bacterium]